MRPPSSTTSTSTYAVGDVFRIAVVGGRVQYSKNGQVLESGAYQIGGDTTYAVADEIVCFPLDPARHADGSLDVLVVGQVMTDLAAAGGQDYDNDDYEQLPKGNLDVSGRYFIWTTNLGGDRLDAFLVQIPGERLMSESVLSKVKLRALKATRP